MRERGLELDEILRLDLLRDVEIESIAGCLAACARIDLGAGEALLRSGQANDTMYLLLSGRLSVHLDGPESEPVAELPAGAAVGELSVIDHRPASADVVAAEPSRLLAVDEASFWRLVRASHQFATNLLVLLAGRMRSTNVAAQRLDLASTIDALTGLRNRRWLEEQLGRVVERELRAGRKLSLAMLDIDHFKRLNDAHGHAAGDRVLVAVAETLVRQIRPLDLAARYGGEEMVLVFPDTPLAGAAVAIERVRRAVGAASVGLPGGGSVSVTFSAGVAEARSGETAAELLHRADATLYEAKRAGRDRVSVAD